VRALIRACDLPHLKLFVHLAYATAGRASALLGLTWDRCDFERGKINLEDPTVVIPHKGRAIVPMTAALRAALTEAHRGSLTPFVIEWGGKRVASVKRGIKAAGARAGLGNVAPHMLRHSAAVRMAEDGVPMEEIAQYLGHSNVNVTRRVYAKFSSDYLRNAARALELDDLGPLRPEDHYAKRRQAIDFMVGATGIEPVTPTMSR
jgi:integrase